jgi:hypothetical protein
MDWNIRESQSHSSLAGRFGVGPDGLKSRSLRLDDIPGGRHISVVGSQPHAP